MLAALIGPSHLCERDIQVVLARKEHYRAQYTLTSIVRL
jgi:hypothetical protein